MMPALMQVPSITLESATASGISSSEGSIPPVSTKTVLAGAWTRLAQPAASNATPVPANSTSPSEMKRPAAIAIISRGVNSNSPSGRSVVAPVIVSSSSSFITSPPSQRRSRPMA